MNIINLFSGLMGLLVSTIIIYWFWNPIVTMINELPTGAAIFVSVSAVIFILLISYFAPLALVTEDD